ncbi:MAG: phage holin family protein [Candidatus Bathyarchaeia archaeon]
MASLKDVFKQILNEAKAALKEYFEETETELKQRLKKLLIFGIATGILTAVVISLVGSASLFFLIGSLRYLETFLPAWQAWLIIGATAAVVAAALLIALALIIWRQFRSAKTKTETVETPKNQASVEVTKN